MFSYSKNVILFSLFSQKENHNSVLYSIVEYV